mmetsp:Transcript_19487/g.50602  ORF Transcript_19487/g.50602 Transcript_19487/m.50602 type:complete len:133 (-) Transcript_19487:3913-4311(-)
MQVAMEPHQEQNAMSAHVNNHREKVRRERFNYSTVKTKFWLCAAMVCSLMRYKETHVHRYHRYQTIKLHVINVTKHTGQKVDEMHYVSGHHEMHGLEKATGQGSKLGNDDSCTATSTEAALYQGQVVKGRQN